MPRPDLLFYTMSALPARRCRRAEHVSKDPAVGIGQLILTCTTAGGQPFRVEYGNSSAHLPQYPFLTQSFQGEADASSPDTHHLGKDCMRHWYIVANQCPQPHQPANAPLAQGVLRVAGGDGLCLGKSLPHLPGKQSGQCWLPLGDLTKQCDRNFLRHNRNYGRIDRAAIAACEQSTGAKQRDACRGRGTRGNRDRNDTLLDQVPRRGVRIVSEHHGTRLEFPADHRYSTKGFRRCVHCQYPCK